MIAVRSMTTTMPCTCQNDAPPPPTCGDVDYYITPGTVCDDNNQDTINDVYNDKCDCVGVQEPRLVC